MSQFLAILTLQTLFYKIMSAFSLEFTNLLNMSDLKGKGYTLTF